MKKKLTTIFALFILDMFSFFFSMLLAIALRMVSGYFFQLMPEFHLHSKMLTQALWVYVLFFMLFVNAGLYTKRMPFWDETKRMIGALIFGVLIAFSIVTLAKLGGSVSRLTLVLFLTIAVIIFPLVRLFGKKLLYIIGIWRTNIVIIGAGESGISAANGIFAQWYMGYAVIGFLDDDASKIGDKIAIGNRQIKVLGRIKSLRKFVGIVGVDTVLVAMPKLSPDKLSEIVNSVHKIVKKIILIPHLNDVALSNTEMYSLFNEKLFLMNIKNNLEFGFNIAIKRIFDISISILMMPILLPVIGIFGLLIKLDSSGQIFYSHVRIGEGGRRFGVFKFRSMHKDSKERLEHILSTDPKAKEEWESSFKLKNDPRVTKVGDFLRKTSLDELPQIFNVLRGDMSLVGPRPVVQEEIKEYYKDYAEYYFAVKPGITGLWQVSGRSDTNYDFRIKMDTWYVLNWSLWLDIIILFKTVKVVLKREGAY